jgi:tRNA U34 5-methylaminomethyl-2-thiouridine-forming methyltransferase MnmC
MTEIILTKDGSHSLLNKDLNETYHSVHGAMQESIHVFIRHGLEYFLQKNQNQSVSILEVGFGTGLNTLLTIQHVLKNSFRCTYTSLEAFPIEEETWTKLNYAESLNLKDDFSKIHQAAWNSPTDILPDFRLSKLHTTLQQVELRPESFDLIYFDAFAPSKQPEMWSFDMLEKVVKTMTPGGVFVTYCAKGQLKRDLKSLGLAVETLEGPPGKKEMVRANKF